MGRRGNRASAAAGRKARRRRLQGGRQSVGSLQGGRQDVCRAEGKASAVGFRGNCSCNRASGQQLQKLASVGRKRKAGRRGNRASAAAGRKAGRRLGSA